MMKVVFMAGGSGTRPWPLSRTGYSKQFLWFYESYIMLRSLMKRLDCPDISSSVKICKEEYGFFVAEQSRKICKLGLI